MKNMTDQETKEHLLEYAKTTHNAFSWPTDACGYDQHIKFVKHRNNNWKGQTSEEFKQFVIDYANSI